MRFIFAYGDDSVFVGQPVDRFTGILNSSGESDFSSYDQSQSQGPLGFSLSLLQRFGMDPSIAQLLLRTLSSKPKVEILEGHGKRKTRYLKQYLEHVGYYVLPSGINITTLSNTIITIVSIIFCINAGFKNFSDTMAFLGLKVKLKFGPVIGSTFLKMILLNDENGKLTYVLLPSRASRLGLAAHSLSEIRAMYDRKKIKDPYRQYLNDVAYANRYFNLIPAHRKYVDKYIVGPNVKLINLKYGIETAGLKEWRGDISPLENRYQLAIEQINSAIIDEDYESMKTMIAIDYGL